MNIESQLQNIFDKSALHAWIDALPDDAKGVIIVEYADPEEATPIGGFQASHSFGPNVTNAQMVWLAQNYIYRAIKHANGDCCRE